MQREPGRVSRGLRIAAGAMTALFVVSAAVQWNDPDPAYWIAIYGVAALLSARAAQGQLPLAPNAVACVVFSALALRALPDLLGAREQAFTHWHMLAARDEVAREAGGLSICAVWSALQTALALGLRRRA
jgi:hypothetical protein